jgi:hypothetical protein
MFHIPNTLKAWLSISIRDLTRFAGKSGIDPTNLPVLLEIPPSTAHFSPDIRLSKNFGNAASVGDIRSRNITTITISRNDSDFINKIDGQGKKNAFGSHEKKRV